MIQRENKPGLPTSRLRVNHRHIESARLEIGEVSARDKRHHLAAVDVAGVAVISEKHDTRLLDESRPVDRQPKLRAAPIGAGGRHRCYIGHRVGRWRGRAGSPEQRCPICNRLAVEAPFGVFPGSDLEADGSGAAVIFIHVVRAAAAKRRVGIVIEHITRAFRKYHLEFDRR